MRTITTANISLLHLFEGVAPESFMGFMSLHFNGWDLAVAHLAEYRANIVEVRAEFIDCPDMRPRALRGLEGGLADEAAETLLARSWGYARPEARNTIRSTSAEGVESFRWYLAPAWHVSPSEWGR